MAGISDCKSVRILVGSAVGGSSDTLARDLQQAIKGATVIVENKPGAAGQIAAQSLIAGTKCDVYVSNPGPLAINEHIKPGVKPALTTMNPIGKMAEYPLLFSVGPSLSKFKDFAAVVEFSKKSPKPLTYGSPGVGSVPHLAMEKLKRETGLVAEHVPYKGSSEAAQALAKGNEIDIAFDAATSLAPLMDRGIRLLGASTGESKDFPVTLAGKEIPVPALMPQGKPFSAHVIVGVVGKLVDEKDRASAQAIVNDVNAGLNKMLTDPAMKKKYQGLGMQLTPGTPADLGAVMKKESVEWKDLAVKYGKE